MAVLDTGVDAHHPDINYAGGVNCLDGANPHHGAGVDPFGHGTGVAGIAGAIDNKIGMVGVAPGVRIWSVRVLDQNDNGTDSSVLCGLDWVAAHADTIDVANMSLGGEGTDTPNCGAGNPSDAIHLAVCNVAKRGVTEIAAAGNTSQDAAGFVPAAYPEVITVSAIADYDGLPGGHAQPFTDCPYGADDAFATFSDFGKVVDIAGPGTCVVTTFPNNSYTFWSGTSFSAPIVAGVAALYISHHKHATPTQVRRAILNAATPGPIPGDPDSYPEGLVNAAPF